MNPHLPLSVLDLAPVPEGTAPSTAVRRTVELAALAERLGYVRYWFAEHHSMPSIGSSAPEVLIAHVAAHTNRIRVGAGGIMLPNHAPLRIAEAFQTLEALHPGRIDLGIGRAPGSAPNASRALRAHDGEQFTALLAEMLALSRGQIPGGHALAGLEVMPDDVALPPVWILGSSGAGATLAGNAGMGYAFASHFSPTRPAPALQAYRESFRPSAQFPKPHAILAVAAYCAETGERARHLAKSMELHWLQIRRGHFAPIPSPETALAHPWTPTERAAVAEMSALGIIGTPDVVRERIERMAGECGADEVMIVAFIHDHAARLRSYELIAEAFDQPPLHTAPVPGHGSRDLSAQPAAPERASP
ncbi:MAG: LLM class flavin-dependent oxidoreductase [Steroidobacteraceae bacterium]